jgi:hypothetical protein
MKRTWIWKLVFALSVVLTSEGTAWAKGITVTIGQQQGGGDPPYDYVIQAYLDPGYGVDYSNSFTINNLVGVTPASLTSEPVNIPEGIS